MIFSKPRRIAAIGSIVCMVPLFVFIFLAIGHIVLPILPVLFVVLFLVSATVTQQMDQKEMQQTLDLFQKQCRPDAAIAVLEPYVQKFIYKRTRTTKEKRQWLLANYCAALCTGGFWSQMQAAALAVEPPTQNVFGFQLQFVMQSNLFICHYATGNYPGAAACHAEMQRLLQQAAGGKPAMQKAAESYYRSALGKEYLLAMAHGNYDGAASFFEKDTLLARFPLEVVSNQYFLGTIYSQLGQWQKATEAYSYAAAQGGTTWYAAAARQALQVSAG